MAAQPVSDQLERAERFPIGARVSLEQLAGDPHALLARLRESEPVSWLPALPGWLVTGHELAERVMRDADLFTVDDPRFSTGQVVGPSMLSLDGPEHARHRAPFSAALRPAATQRDLAPDVRADCGRLLDGLAGAGRAELRRELAGPLAVAAVARVLGLRDVNAATVLGWYSAIVSAVSAITAGEPVDPAAGRAVAELAAAVGVSIGAEHHSLLAGAVRPAGELTEAEAVSNAAVLMFGGIDTTEAMIANLLWLLLSDRTRWQAVLADRGLVPDAVEESLRLEPAAAVVDRYSTAAVELAAARIGERELVRVSITGANRDPAVFADPNSFRLDRPKLARQLAFARGPHFCLGMELARVQATAVLEQLLDRLPGARLDPATQPGPRGLVFRKPAGVWVSWD